MPRTTNTPHTATKNPLLVRGVELRSRSAAYRKRHGWLKKRPASWNAKPATTAEAPKKSTYRAITADGKVLKTKPLGKKGQTRDVRQKAPRSWAVERPRHPLLSRKNRHRQTRLRKSLVPGKILIILSGRYKAHRVVFLKQLDSGLLLVTGPYLINGVPLRRVNQAYVIGTTTRLDISGVKLDPKINDKYFKQTKKQAKQAREAKRTYLKNKRQGILPKHTHPNKQYKKGNWALPNEKRTIQKSVDAQLLPLIKKTPLLSRYLKAKFSLKKGQFPHQMRF
jgi:large subunit ribosomal protein L6e